MTQPGPPALGRGVIVDGDQPAPAAWATAPEVVVDEAALAEPALVVAALHGAWAGRSPVVVRLRVDPGRFRQPVAHDPDPLRAGPSFEPWLDRLHHLVWANTYDARSGEPIWWWGRKAQRLGAGEGGAADVLLADGAPAWVDGGPRVPLARQEVDGHAVVHAETVELGRMATEPEPRPPTADLAPDQLAAVAHGSGAARIVAPAGSGKTRVLTERVRHLVKDRGYDPAAVLAVAFNVRAKKEMEGRLRDVAGVRVQTLNGLGWWVLRRARAVQHSGQDGERGGLRVLGERDVRDVVGRLVEVRRRTNTDPISPYLDGLSRIRLGLADPAQVEAELDGEADGLAERVWPTFRERLARAGGVDFDEQVFGAVEALLADGELRRWAQAQCRHLLVDEFQDLTPCHLLLVRLLAVPGLDVFGVGDDDQVLYGYMGATPRFLIGFDRWFPGGGAHPLEVNHRCPAAVTSAASSLLQRNKVRVPKAIRPGPAVETDPACLQVRRHDPERAATEVLEAVQGWLDQGTAPAAVAVLSRVNSLLLAPQVALREAGVPVASDLGEEVLRRTGVQAALAYLRLAADPGAMSGADIAAILKRPSRGGLPQWLPDRLHKRTWSVRSLGQLADSLQKDRERQNLQAVASDLDQLAAAAKGGVRASLSFVRDDIGLGQAMGLLDSSKGAQGGSNIDDLEALLQLAELHDEVATFEAWLRSHLAQASDEGGVTLATVHRVKGQEWDHVVLFGMTDGVSPHRLAVDVEEERRVVHVGITRCRRSVVVLGDATRPSPFLDELEGRDPPARGRAPWTAPPAAVPARRGPQPIVPGDPTISAALKAWRTEKAAREGKPPYIYLTDALVEAIATRRPATLFELRALPGIGPKKLDEYGEDLLAVVRDAAATDGGAGTDDPHPGDDDEPSADEVG